MSEKKMNKRKQNMKIGEREREEQKQKEICKN